MRIEYLADNTAFIEKVAGWIYLEFFEGIRHGVPYPQVLNSIKICNKTDFPIRLVALEGDTCIGTVSLVENDLKYRDYTPWLAALYVDESFRGNKTGRELVERTKAIARELGYNELFLRTEHAGQYYIRLGWQYVETCIDEFNLQTEVYKWNLAEGSNS